MGTDDRPLVVHAEDVSLHYRANREPSEFIAVRGVTMSIRQGEILGMVGESGSGKSTLAMAIAGLAGASRPDSGIPEICGGELTVLGQRMRALNQRARDQVTLLTGYLPQNGAERLSPDFTIAESVAEPIYRRDRDFNTREAADAVACLIDAVRLPLGVMNRMPWELSSGQRQRVALARSLILDPVLLVADEPTRGVDATVRDGVLEVVRELQRERDFSALVVSSDLTAVTAVADRVVVMRRGLLIGDGALDELLANPEEPYLRGLKRARELTGVE